MLDERLRETVTGCVNAALLRTSRKSIATARAEERQGRWKTAACYYANAARQLAHISTAHARIMQAKALGRAGFCLSRHGDLPLAVATWADCLELCRHIGESNAAESIVRMIHAAMKNISKEGT